MRQKTVILVSGPTASGKTSLAIELATHFQTEIISADSRQCFIEMNIGVAKPSVAQLQMVKHWFINSHSINEEVNAGSFEKYALQATDEVFRDHDTAIVAGGTGLYIKAFCEGLDEMPSIPVEIRLQVISQYKQNGLEWLQAQLREKDPVYYETGELLNPQRLMRALEIKLATGRSIRDFQRKKKASRSFNIVKAGIDLPKELLHANINKRVDQMMEDGLLDEVRSLLPFREKNALQTVGYTELIDHLDGKISLEEAIARIKINTRHYAKRQLTWFRKDPDISWVGAPDATKLIEIAGL